MVKAIREQILALTKEIVEDYWRGDIKLLLSHLHPEAFWIGSMDHEYISGSEKVLSYLSENQQQMVPVYLKKQEYEMVHHDKSSCLVVGRYHAFTDPDSGILLSEKQRVTFLWVKQGEEIQIKHIHLSNILHIQDEEERFPIRAGKEAYRYLQQVLADKNGNQTITIKDYTRTMRVISCSDIIYLIADHNYTRLYLAGRKEEIRFRRNLSGVLEELPDDFILLNRSSIINRNMVKEIQGNQIIMSDGMNFTIPKPRCATVKAMIYGQKTT